MVQEALGCWQVTGGRSRGLALARQQEESSSLFPRFAFLPVTRLANLSSWRDFWFSFSYCSVQSLLHDARDLEAHPLHGARIDVDVFNGIRGFGKPRLLQPL